MSSIEPTTTRAAVAASEYPVDRKSVDLVLAAIVREVTQGMCTSGKVCDLCDCFAGPALFAWERRVAEQVLRDGVARVFRGGRSS